MNSTTCQPTTFVLTNRRTGERTRKEGFTIYGPLDGRRVVAVRAKHRRGVNGGFTPFVYFVVSDDGETYTGSMYEHERDAISVLTTGQRAPSTLGV